METVAFHITLKSRRGRTYKALHDPVPPEVFRQLGKAGIQNFSIFLDGDHVFGVFEYKSEKLIQKHLSKDAHPKWTKEVINICKIRELDPDLPLLKRLERVFKFEGTK
jgi:L-rhamnose mutarotase